MNTGMSSYLQPVPVPPNDVDAGSVDWKRLGLVTAAGALTGLAVARRNPVFFLAAGVGAVAGWKLMSSSEARPESVAVELVAMEQMTRSMSVRRPAEFIYNLVRNLQNIPLFLPPIKLVNDNDNGFAALTLKTWALTAVIDVHITSDTPNRSVAFELLRNGSKFAHIRIKLEPNARNDATIVSAAFRYHPMLGGLVNKVVRPVMVNEVDTYLMRLKQLAETGEIARAK